MTCEDCGKPVNLCGRVARIDVDGKWRHDLEREECLKLATEIRMELRRMLAELGR